MLQYLIKRLLLLGFTLFGIMVLTFVITRLTPGDPALLQTQGETSRQGGASLDDLIERNRRNLGLDKPLLLNLRSQGPSARAHSAIDDLFRRTEFWNRSGERRLIQLSTLAIPAALERFPMVGDPQEPEVRDSRGELVDLASDVARRQRLAAVLPRLTAGALRPIPGEEPEVTFQRVRAWYLNQAGRLNEVNAQRIVAAYLETGNGLSEVTALGGYAIEPLMRGLRRTDTDGVFRVNAAMEVLTGFVFHSTLADRDEIAADLTFRWLSWWRREAAGFVNPGPFGSTFNVIRDTQFGLWMSQVIVFDFGESFNKRRPVISLFAEALPVSLLLSVLSIFITYLVAIPLGIISAMRRHTKSDRVITLILFILYSLPSFWVAGILILFFTGPPFLNAFPVRGLGGSPDQTFVEFFFDRLWHLVLPVFCLTYGSLAYLSRQMRGALLETINQDFIRTARAKGLDERTVIFRHALRNSLIPILTISASILPELIAGAVIIESIFTIPGMGTLTFEAIVNRDYPVINAVVFFSAFLTLLGILIVDLSYALVDPRITYAEDKS